MSRQNSGHHSTVLSEGRRSKRALKGRGRLAQPTGSLRGRLRRFLGHPQDLDIRGLGSKVCEVLGIRSGDTIEFHVLADGSVRIVNYGSR
jgi:hypothetical protein